MSRLANQLSASDEREVLDILARRGKIAAVKYVRSRYEVGLIQASHIVDDVKAAYPDAPSISFLDQPFPSFDANGSKNRWVVPLIGMFLLLGFAFQFGAYLYWNSCNAIVEQGHLVPAQVVAVEGAGRPTFEYVWNGETFRWRSSFSEERKSGSGSYHVGDASEVFVDENDPSSPLVNDFMHKWLIVVILVCIGTGLIFPALVLAIIFHKPYQTPSW